MTFSPSYHFLGAIFNVHPDSFLNRLSQKDGVNNQEDSVLDSINRMSREYVDKHELINMNDESVESFNALSVDKWRSSHPDEKRSPFEFLRRVAEELIVMKGDVPFSNISMTDLWRRLTLQMGEDILTTASLADRYLNHGTKPPHFQWNYILHSNFSGLNAVLFNKGLFENHFHLFGSAPNVDLSWLSMMNDPFGRAACFKRFGERNAMEENNVNTVNGFSQTSIYLLVQMAAYIRLRLFEECCLVQHDNPWTLSYIIGKLNHCRAQNVMLNDGYINEMINVYRYLSKYRVEGRAVDYAIHGFIVREDLNNRALSGERNLYYNCLRKIFLNNKRSYDIYILFYLYILIKNRFAGLFFQRNGKYGFDNFQKYQDLKHDIIENTIYARLAVTMALKENVDENRIEKLEARITPKDTAEYLRGSIRYCDENSKLDKQKYFFVIHFLKTKESEWGISQKEKSLPKMRESALRRKLKKQALVIQLLRERNESAAHRIAGIDASSSEVNCRPEVFGQVFRFLTETTATNDFLSYDKEKRKLPPLRKTYHVGEDFYDLADGLRSIDEAIMYLGLKYGDRIGHGVALGLDPAAYYSCRRQIAMPLQNMLDNYAWLLYCINRFNIDIKPSFISEIQYQFDRLLNQLDEVSQIAKGLNTKPDLMAYIDSWKLRGDNPMAYRKECKKNKGKDRDYLKEIIQDNLSETTPWSRFDFRSRTDYQNISPTVYNLYHRYHFDSASKYKARQIIEREVTSDYVDLVSKVQICMRDYVLKTGVAIESCPSSNFLISKLNRIIDLPTFRLYPIVEKEGELLRLNTSINTDDQGVFYTSLVKEYTLLANALQNELTEVGLRKYSDEMILDWIEKLADNGREQCFSSC